MLYTVYVLTKIHTSINAILFDLFAPLTIFLFQALIIIRYIFMCLGLSLSLRCELHEASSVIVPSFLALYCQPLEKCLTNRRP
jgi:hypothetical protein